MTAGIESRGSCCRPRPLSFHQQSPEAERYTSDFIARSDVCFLDGLFSVIEHTAVTPAEAGDVVFDKGPDVAAVFADVLALSLIHI